MLHSPRLAVGSIQPAADRRPILWALIDLLQRSGRDVQTFRDEARFAAHDGPAAITGRRSRHLDTWLMSPETCREIFSFGAASCDVAIIEGKFDAACECGERRSSLDEICRRLETPAIAVVDATQLSPCRIGPPPRAAGVLLDRVRNAEEGCLLRTTLEAMWGVPVLGVMEEHPALRAIVSGLGAGQPPSRELCRALGARLAPRLALDRLLRIASAAKLPPSPPRLFERGVEVEGLRVAVAYDDAMGCYFPDTLDLLELRGATLRDFSPLRCDRLPCGTDVVYIGCGHPERHAAALAGNHCLRASLRNFARSGGRVFAEGGGLAYLCEEIQLLCGKAFPMAGILPAVARQQASGSPTGGVEVTLAYDTWLGKAATRLRGYLDDSWRIEPSSPLTSCAVEADRRDDFFSYGRILGSRLHINFAAQEEFLARFFEPHPTALAFAH